MPAPHRSVFLKAKCPSCRPTNSVKALKAHWAVDLSRYQKGKTNLDFTEARDSKWQWHQLGHMQVCTSLQKTMPAPHRSVFFTGRMPFLPPNQQHQITEGNDTKLVRKNVVFAEPHRHRRWH